MDINTGGCCNSRPGVAPAHTVSGLDCVTCLDQQDISKCDASRGLINTCLPGLVLLEHSLLETSRHAGKQLGLGCGMMRRPLEREPGGGEAILDIPATVELATELPAAGGTSAVPLGIITAWLSLANPHTVRKNELLFCQATKFWNGSLCGKKITETLVNRTSGLF